MVEAALYVLVGTILSAGAYHLYLGSTRSSTQPHAQLAAMYLLLAGFVLASALFYQSQEISVQLRLARLAMTMAILLWLALIWHVAFYSRSKPLILLDLLTAAWVVLLIRNISSPHGLLYADIAPIDATALSAQNLSALYAGVDSWWTALKSTMLVSLLFCFYAGVQLFRRGNRQAALALLAGLSMLVTASLADPLLDTRVIQSLSLAAFGFIGFLLANSVYPVLLDYRKRRKADQAAVIYSLTFNPDRASFDSELSELHSPPAEEPELAVADAPEPVAETDLESLPSSTFTAKEAELAGNLAGNKAVDTAVIEPALQAGRKNSSGGTGRETPWQEPPTAVSKRGQSSLTAVSDNLMDIAVYATMLLNRGKRGDTDPQALEILCRKIRSKAIKTRRMANHLSRPGQAGNDSL